MLSRLEGRDPAALHLVHVLGLLALVAGLVVLRGTEIGADPLAALGGLASVLPTTGRAAVAVALSALLSLAAGGVLARLVAGRPFRSLAMATVFALAGAVLLETVLLAALAPFGLFHWPVLLLANATVLAVGSRVRPVLAARPAPPSAVFAWPVAWVLIALVWSGPLVVQLASPVVPFLDVLPNHVAPVEHLREFGVLASVDTTPSPIYGPSRIFLGYQSLLAVVVEIVEIPAVTAVGAFAVPLSLLVGAAGYGLARTLGGPVAGMWALLLVPLSVTFLRLADARAGVVAFPLAALALWLLQSDVAAGPRRRDVLLASTLTAGILVHPLIGLLAAASVGLLAVMRPAAHGWSLAAVVAAPAGALGQWIAMLGIDAPAWFALLGVPAALAVLGVAWQARPAVARASSSLRVARRLPLLVGAAFALAALALAAAVPGGAGLMLGGVAGVVEWYVALLLAAGLSLVVARHRPGSEIPWAPVAVCALAGAAASVVPTGSTLGDSVRFELPKTLTYLAPTFLAIAGAVGLAAAWEARALPVLARGALLALVLVLAAAPIRSGVVHELSLGEHRLSESLSISLRNAASGYWRGYPDERRLIDPPRAELVEALRAEIDAGRLTGRSRVLHVAASFQPWAATPLAAFTGVVETTATLDPERSIHTQGGRLEDVADLADLLLGGFDYLVLEPDGLPRDYVVDITAAGFTPVFAGERGSVYRRPFMTRVVEARARPR